MQCKGMKQKHIAELLKVRNKEKYTKSNDFWAPLCQASIVSLVTSGAPSHRILGVEITEWGNIVLDSEVVKQ